LTLVAAVQDQLLVRSALDASQPPRLSLRSAAYIIEHVRADATRDARGPRVTSRRARSAMTLADDESYRRSGVGVIHRRLDEQRSHRRLLSFIFGDTV